MSVDKVLHNYRTPLRASLIVSKQGLTVQDFIKSGVIINSDSGKLQSLDIENKKSYYLTNDGETVLWKQPPWLEIDAPSPTQKNVGEIITYPSEYRRITVSESAPQSFQGSEGDIWMTFI
jgi:hypothetical protein